MSSAKVSIIIPTWQRHKLLTTRCLPSVHELDWPWVEAIIVSDGPDPGCRQAVHDWWSAQVIADLDVPAEDRPQWRAVRYFELPEHDPQKHWGNPARLHGLTVATGSLIGYLDDDDAFRPEHLRLLVAALERRPDALYAYSQMMSHTYADNVLVGGPHPMAGNIGTPMLLHRRELLDIATWGTSDAMEDWNLIGTWEAFAVPYEFVPVVTVDVWPSQIHNH